MLTIEGALSLIRLCDNATLLKNVAFEAMCRIEELTGTWPVVNEKKKPAPKKRPKRKR